MGTSPQQMSPAQINAIARQAIKARSVKETQPIFSASSIVPANTPVVTVNPRNVGLLTGFWVKVTHVVHNGSGVQIDLTDFGPANALSQIQFNDFNNQTRLQTSGWHLAFVNSVKQRRPFGTALVHTTGIDAPTNYGSNWTQQISAPANIAAAGNGTVIMWYYVPLAYSSDDLRGCVYANLTNAQAQLFLSMPGTNGVSVAVANGTDSTLALYVGDAAGSVAAVSITSTAITVYQEFFDQLPIANNAVLLPVTDLATIYELKATVQTSLVAGQDFPYQYPNFRDILSTTVVYVNTAATGARGVGADINYWALQAANVSNIWKKEPGLVALETRNFLQTDMPPGVYYFGSRQKPISTTQYGNMQLINNPITAGTGAYQLVGIEDFALIQTLTQAGSLAAS